MQEQVTSDGPPWTPPPFILSAAGLISVQLCYGAVPRWALRSATWILGLGMILYGALGISLLSIWGAWWLLGGVLFVTTAWCHSSWGWLGHPVRVG